MSDQKPITFKSRKPAAKPAEETEQAEVNKIETPVTTPVVETPKTDTEFAAKIEAAKKATEEQNAEDKSVEDAVARIAAAAPAEPVKQEVPKAEELKTEEQKEDDSFISYWDENVGKDSVPGVKDYVPTDEDIERAKKCADNKDNDASRVVAAQLGSENELLKAFDYIKTNMEKYKNLSQSDIDSHPEIKAILTWLSDLNAIVESSLQTQQQSLLTQMVAALNKNGKILKRVDKKLSIAKMNTSLGTAGQPKLLRGDTAMQVINNRYRGTYKIQLHNSGFWIKIVPLKPEDLDAWMQEVDFERKQIGRIIGGHFYVGQNIYLKEKLADLVKHTVIECNLQGWKEGNTLIDSISIHDYETLCWAYATMMHKDGISISTVCVNPDCRHHNTSQYLDLARLTYINPDVYTEEAMQFMIAGSAPGVIRTKEDIKNYKEKMLKNVRLVKFTETDQYELKDPSLGEFIRTGMAVLGRLAAAVKDGKLDKDDEDVRRHAVYQLSKMLSSWISKIILNDENGKMVGVIDDRAAITQALETSLDDEHHIVKAIEDFITNSKVSFYSAVSLKCPKCGHQPNLLTDNIFPLDMEYVLFCLSYLKLEQIGQRR